MLQSLQQPNKKEKSGSSFLLFLRRAYSVSVDRMLPTFLKLRPDSYWAYRVAVAFRQRYVSTQSATTISAKLTSCATRKPAK